MLKYVLAIACLLFVAPLTSFAQSARPSTRRLTAPQPAASCSRAPRSTGPTAGPRSARLPARLL